MDGPCFRAVIDAGTQKTIKMLLDAGANVAHRDKNNKTALEYAAERKATDTISLLKKYKAK